MNNKQNGNRPKSTFQRYLPYIFLGIIVICFISVFSYTVNHKLDLNGDNATYIQLARNMAEGHGYTTLNLEGEYVPASHFPPGYSALLSFFMRIGIDSLMAFKILNGIFLGLGIIILYFITWKVTKQLYLAFSIAILSVLPPSTLHFAGMVMSEMSYMLATVLAILSLFLYDRQMAKKRDPELKSSQVSPFYKSPYFYTAILFGAAAYYIRSIGSSILFAILVFFLFRKEWKAAIASVAGIAVCLLPWIIRNSVHHIKGRYLGTVMTVNPWRPEEGQISSIGEMVDKMLTNINDTVIQGFRTILFPFSKPENGFGYIILGIIILGIVIWGIWNMGKMRWAFLAFLLANIGVFALWHGGNGTRYVTPLVPFVFMFFYTGVFFLTKCVCRKKAMKENRIWPSILLFLVVPMIEPIEQMHESVRRPYPMAYTNYFAIAQAVEKDMPEHSIVCCRKPELFSYYSPHSRTTNYLYSLETDSVIANLVRKNVDFVVLDQLGYSSTARYLYPAIRKNPELFQTVYHLTGPDTYLFRFNKEEAKQKIGIR